MLVGFLGEGGEPENSSENHRPYRGGTGGSNPLPSSGKSANSRSPWFLLVKGAPEVILDHCNRQAGSGGQPKPIDRGRFANASDELAAQGERVLAFAWLQDPGVDAGNLGPADLPKNLVLLGLIGLLDPPRTEAMEAVTECHAGGIRVTMITGDHKITAAAIARMLGIGDGRTAITGTEIEEMDTATLQERVRDVDVFARASPEHKLRLVKAIQANKQIVAMTGDGMNNAACLKKADVGVAMGIKGFPAGSAEDWQCAVGERIMVYSAATGTLPCSVRCHLAQEKTQ